MTDLMSQVVATDRGTVRGSDEGPVFAFRGIPYAASPVGALRLAAPQNHPGGRKYVRPSAPVRPHAGAVPAGADHGASQALLERGRLPHPERGLRRRPSRTRALAPFWSGSTEAVSPAARADGTGTTEPVWRRPATCGGHRQLPFGAARLPATAADRGRQPRSSGSGRCAAVGTGQRRCFRRRSARRDRVGGQSAGAYSASTWHWIPRPAPWSIVCFCRAVPGALRHKTRSRPPRPPRST
ncbi:hypothetical protein E4K10_00570 [Streptomyces sp. T1317-0309]|nr:hypothetical protein E4K10_00570 [Streptomyces sp. T1317-0309]